MKKVILFMIVIIWSQILFCVSVKMDDGLVYVGTLSAKQRGNIYLTTGNMLYGLPVTKIVNIENNGVNITAVILNTEDFSDINIEDNKYSFYKYGSNESEENDNANSKEVIQKMSDHKIDYTNSKDALLKMSDREFAIYELGLKQKQADMISRKIDRVNDTLWTIWGISIGASVITFLLL